MPTENEVDPVQAEIERAGPYWNMSMTMQFSDVELLQTLKAARNVVASVCTPLITHTECEVKIGSPTDPRKSMDYKIPLEILLLISNLARKILQLCDGKWDPDEIRKEYMLSCFPRLVELSDDIGRIIEKKGSLDDASRLRQFVPTAVQLERAMLSEEFINGLSDPSIVDEGNITQLDVPVLDIGLSAKVAEAAISRFIAIVEQTREGAARNLPNATIHAKGAARTPDDGANAAAPESCLSAAAEEIVANTSVSLGGFAPDGSVVDLASTIDDLNLLEAQFVGWKEAIIENAKLEGVTLDKDNLTEEIRKQLKWFNEHGGHVSRYSREQQEAIFRGGVIALIKLNIRGKLVTIGAVTALSRNPWTNAERTDGKPRNAQGWHEKWPQFDSRAIMLPSGQQPAILASSDQTFLNCRSSMLPSLDCEYVREQLGKERLPPEWEGQKLQRLGLIAYTKGCLFRLAKQFGSQFAMSNIVSLKFKNNPLPYENRPSRGLNRWMGEPLGWRENFHMELDPRSGLYMGLRAYMGDIDDGLRAVSDIAARKGLDLENMDRQAHVFHRQITSAIGNEEHEPW